MPLTGVGKGVGVKKPAPKIKLPQMFSPSQQVANAKALDALQGIKNNLKTASNIFRKK